jgi:hypothetical protein
MFSSLLHLLCKNEKLKSETPQQQKQECYVPHFHIDRHSKK